jgi:hypothetical protein
MRRIQLCLMLAAAIASPGAAPRAEAAGLLGGSALLAGTGGFLYGGSRMMAAGSIGRDSCAFPREPDSRVDGSDSRVAPINPRSV